MSRSRLASKVSTSPGGTAGLRQKPNASSQPIDRHADAGGHPQRLAVDGERRADGGDDLLGHLARVVGAAQLRQQQDELAAALPRQVSTSRTHWRSRCENCTSTRARSASARSGAAARARYAIPKRQQRRCDAYQCRPKELHRIPLLLVRR
jgi:hypothetical protein